MTGILDMLSSLPDLLLVVLGFSAIIIIHEAGHFFAARWAGIRVLAFAVGFGPALLSFRKGLGLRKGSSEQEYNQLLNDARGESGDNRFRAKAVIARGLSPTEYRLNWLPFGGYVKMLGQDDADPTARSDEPDSYQNCPPWKRMVVISAGVVFNIITAAILFVVVFNPAIGLKSEPAQIGKVFDPDSPAAVAVASNAKELGVTEPGLKPGDTILSINGEVPNHFGDVTMMIAMSNKNDPVRIDVQRPNLQGVLHFAIKPDTDPISKLLVIGVSPIASDHLQSYSHKRDREQYDKTLEELGFPELKSDMRLVEINGVAASSPYSLDSAVQRSDGKPVSVTFVAGPKSPTPDKHVTVSVKPEPKLLTARVKIGDAPYRFDHLLGLTPVLAVADVAKGSAAESIGLKHGDVFARIGTLDWPSVPAGIKEIRNHKHEPLAISVERKSDDGKWVTQDLGTAKPDGEGHLGFTATDSASLTNVVARWPLSVVDDLPATPSGGSLAIVPGSRIVAVDGHPVPTLGDLRDELKRLTSAEPNAPLSLEVRSPAGAETKVPWMPSPDEIASLSHLGWDNPLNSTAFAPKTFTWRADTVWGAIPMGLHETHRVMMQTYLTFARLFQGSVKVEHLKGPIGIAHIGVNVADRGYIWLLFFMALISVNLAVINFLPMPIADGGHMVFLIYEQISGRPPSVKVQNAAAIVGLVLIGTVLLVVTYNDIHGVFQNVRQFFNK
jgi:regulator of sigma E protease